MSPRKPAKSRKKARKPAETKPTEPAKPLQRDRAFRALAAESPEVVPRLLVAAGILPADSAPIVAKPLPTGLDPPLPRLDVDFVGETPDGSIFHLEWQGWRGAAVRGRLFDYHLTLVLRSKGAPVRSVVVWSRKPSAEERAPYTTGQLTLAVDHVVLEELAPEPFLADPATACFAMACRTDDPVALAKRVVHALQGAPPRAAVVAALAAASLGTYAYKAFLGEWKARGMEPIVVIEEVERMVADMAHERGFAEGEELGRREGELARARITVADLAEIIGVPLDERRRAWIAGASLAELDERCVVLKRERAWPG